MPRSLHLDFESFSEIDLTAVGCYRYSKDPTTEILIAAMAFDDEEPVAWDCTMEEWECDHLQPYWEALRDPSVIIWAHNAMMESSMCQALLMKTWGIPAPAIERFRCTMSLARRASLPGKLEKLAEVLELKDLKDARGKLLMKKFSMMQIAKKPTKKNPAGLPVRRIFPRDEPGAFQEYVQYCLQDVRAEQGVQKKLAYFADPINDANYVLDQKINARGVPVNLSALRHAQKLIDEETAIVSRQFRELTGFEVTQRDVFLTWLRKGGAMLEDLQAETIEAYLEGYDGLPDDQGFPALLALRLKQSIAYASIKKVRTMLECAGPHDAKVRGLLTHHGAGTGRWTASLIQPQNFKRPTIKHSEDAYRDICGGISKDMLECCHGPVLEVISSSVRHFIHDTPNNIFAGDYAAIEARIVCWLAGQEDALERFRAYDRAEGAAKKALDPYRIMASEVYGIPVQEIEPFPHRFIGKGLVLGAGFKLSPAGFRRQCLDQAKYDLPEGLEDHAIGLWRKKHKKVVTWWGDLDKASKSAILHRGKIFPAGKVSFMCKEIEGTLFLLMKLPSGRNIAYPRPKLVHGKYEGTTQIEYFGNIKGAMWGSCRLWAGVLANNATQGTDADVMFVGAHNCEREGYRIFNVVHDEAHSYIGEGQTGKRFVELMMQMPDWTKGLPVAAEGGEAPFYRKS